MTYEVRQRLRDFYEDYAICLDENDLDAWTDFFDEDCHYRVQSRENHDANLPLGLIYCMNKNMIKDRVLALRETTMFEPRTLRHFISNIQIKKIEGDEIHSQANFMITEALSDKEPVISMVGMYIDVIKKEGDGFLIKKRDCIHDNYRVLTSLITPV